MLAIEHTVAAAAARRVDRRVVHAGMHNELWRRRFSSIMRIRGSFHFPPLVRIVVKLHKLSE
jgi:hypothetical protein